MKPNLVCSTTTYLQHGPRAAIINLGETDLQTIELQIHTEGRRTRWGEPPLLTDRSSPEEVKEAGRLMERHQVHPESALITGSNPRYSEGMDVILRKLEICRLLGIRCVVGDAGVAPTDRDREILYRNLREIGDAAREKGIVYCFDMLPGICQNHRGMLRTIGDLAHPAFRLNFDPGQLLYYNEDPIVEVALSKICHLVGHVHLKDCMGEKGYWYFPALGYGGAVDFLRIYQIMRDMAFQGPMALSIDGIEDEGPMQIRQIHLKIRESLDTLRDCGYFDYANQEVEVDSD